MFIVGKSENIFEAQHFFSGSAIRVDSKTIGKIHVSRLILVAQPILKSQKS